MTALVCEMFCVGKVGVEGKGDDRLWHQLLRDHALSLWAS